MAANRRRKRGGNMILEAVLFIPFLLLLMVGMLRIGEITYLYYTLKKALYATAQYLATQQGVDFCADSTGMIAAAKNFGLTGTTDGSAESFLPLLTVDLLDVSPECYDPATQTVTACVLSCDGSAANLTQPDYVVVSIPTGYSINPRIPYILSQEIPLFPFVRVPFGGT
jgi:Flp pilus assembly protein TadG